MSDPTRVKEVFFSALDLDTDELDEWLPVVCGGDAELEAEVRSLLEHHQTRSLLLSSTPPSGPTPSHPTTVPTERYRRLDELGAGGFGRVVRCFDRKLRRTVAAKEARPGKRELADHLLHEARLLAYLDHPGVVPVFDVDAGEGMAYTMKVLAGESLEDRLCDLEDQGLRMPISEAVRIVARVSETMANAHAKGVMHLDLKPANVMLEAYGRVSVIDWGISRFFDVRDYQQHLEAGGEPTAGVVANDGPSAGTPAYMPAEQFGMGTAPLGPRADVYSVGTMLFEMLSGQLPFARAPHVAALALQKANNPAPDPAPLRPGIPQRLGLLCQRMMAPTPDGRPGSFDEVLDALSSLGEFGAALEVMELADGELLFREGDEGETAYQIVAGALEVSIERDGASTVLATRQAGDLIGELALLSKRPRTATVRAVGPTRVRPLDWPGLEAELEKVDPLVGRLLRALSDKLVEATGA